MPIEPKIETHRFSRYYTVLEPLFARPKVRAYTMLILSFFTMSFFGYFAIRPTLATISTLRRQIADARFVNQKLQEKINALTAASAAYEAIKPDLGIIFTALPQENKFGPLVKGLEGIATESGTAIYSLSFQPVSLSPLEATSAAKETPIGFNLTLTGDYTKLSDFVRRLSRFERLAVVEKMGLSAREETKELRLTLIGKMFYVQ